jgi:hypothetical protein
MSDPVLGWKQNKKVKKGPVVKMGNTVMALFLNLV